MGQQYMARKKRVGDRGPGKKSGQNDHFKTAETIADEQGQFKMDIQPFQATWEIHINVHKTVHIIVQIIYHIFVQENNMTKKTNPALPPEEWKGRRLTDEELVAYRNLNFGHLDDYFAMMIPFAHVTDDVKEVYELAVRAFINDMVYNGLPSIRRERYNREFAVSLAMCGLNETVKTMKITP
jgi:hypothetical protein